MALDWSRRDVRQGKLVLTDLESTNGTRVNGEDVQLRILRYGDVISLGRSVLLYGTREQTAGRLDSLREKISIVAQETFLFNDTVANNIGYGLAGASREPVTETSPDSHWISRSYAFLLPYGPPAP